MATRLRVNRDDRCLAGVADDVVRVVIDHIRAGTAAYRIDFAVAGHPDDVVTGSRVDSVAAASAIDAVIAIATLQPVWPPLP